MHDPPCCRGKEGGGGFWSLYGRAAISVYGEFASYVRFTTPSSRSGESNPGPPPYHGGALPI